MKDLTTRYVLAMTILLAASSAFAANNVGPGSGDGDSPQGSGGGSGSDPTEPVMRVPLDYPTIQAAIDAASDGDHIMVWIGTYTGSGASVIDTKGKAVWIEAYGHNPIAAAAIDGQGQRTCVVCDSGEGSDTIIEGFRIMNGESIGSGGGVRCSGSSPTFKYCTFRNNLAEQDGGGMYSTNGSPTLVGCTFEENAAWDDGGGLYTKNGTPTLTDCVFTNNFGSSGAGMHSDGGSPALTNCFFTSNLNTWGGGMMVDDSNITLTACSFTANEADYGGGILIAGSSTVVISNGTFTDNFGANEGGAISNSQQSSLTLVDTNFTGNAGYYQGGAIANYGELHMSGCTLTGNTIDDCIDSGDGGGLYTTADIGGPTSSIINCVITGNVAAVSGGGIHVEGSASSGLELIGSTICGNSGGQITGLYADGGGNLIAEVCGAASPADVTHDGYVDGADMAYVLGAWGSSDALADIDQDGVVGGADLSILLAAWN